MNEFDWNSKEWKDLEVSIFETDAFRNWILVIVAITIICKYW